MATCRLQPELARLVWFWLLSVFIYVPTLNAQQQSASRFVIDSSVTAERELRILRERIQKENDTLDAAQILKLRTIHGNEIVPVALNHWQRVGYSLDALLGQLPADKLDRHARVIESIAAGRYAQAIQSSDGDLLKDMIDSGYHSPSAQKAINRLAENAWHRGDFDFAKHYWTQLVPLSRDKKAGEFVRRIGRPESFDKQVLKKLVYCELASDDHGLAEQHWDVLCNTYHDNFTKSAFEELLKNFPRSPKAQDTRDEFRSMWNFQVPSARSSLSKSMIAFSAGSNPFGQSQRLFLLSDDSVFGFEAKKGKPLWPVDRNDTGTLIFQRPAESTGASTPRAISISLVEEQRLLATYDDAIYCLDVNAGEGKLLWSYPNTCLNCELEPLRISSQAICDDGNVIFSIREGTNFSQSSVACLDIRTGAPTRKIAICNRLGTSASHQGGLDTIAEGIGRHFLMTADGLLSAVDVGRNRIEWFYDVAAELQHDGQWKIAYCDGKLLAWNTDQPMIIAFEVTSGTKLWHSTLPMKMKEFLGQRNGVFFFNSEKMVYGFDGETGAIKLRSPILPDVLYCTLRASTVEVITPNEWIVIACESGKVTQSSSTGISFGQSALVIAEDRNYAAGIGRRGIHLYEQNHPPGSPQSQFRKPY